MESFAVDDGRRYLNRIDGTNERGGTAETGGQLSEVALVKDMDKVGLLHHIAFCQRLWQDTSRSQSEEVERRLNEALSNCESSEEVSIAPGNSLSSPRFTQLSPPQP